MATKRSTQREHETWEAVGRGAVWVTLTNDRGVETQRQIGGPGGVTRLRIKAEDREAMQDAFPFENPFESGRLRRVDSGAPAVQAAKTDQDLLDMLASPSLEDDLMSATEFEVRRLKDLAQESSADAVSVAQLYVINQVISKRWPKPDAPSDQVAAATERFEIG